MILKIGIIVMKISPCVNMGAELYVVVRGSCESVEPELRVGYVPISVPFLGAF